MRRRLKYRPPARRHRAATFLGWLLAFGILTAFGWLWRESDKKTKPATPGRVATVNPPAMQRRAAIPPPVAPGPLPVQEPATQPQPPRTVLDAQIALVQRGISPGSLDGVIGSQTRAALTAFQESEHLPVTGKLDDLTRVRLVLCGSAMTNYIVSSNDLARIQPLSSTWLGKSQQTALDFETILELVAEKSLSHPDLIRRLNPAVNWTNITAGTTVQTPNAAFPEPRSKAAFIEIHLTGKTLKAFDVNTNLLVHFPCSIAKLVEKRPVGELHVNVIAPRPNYTFDPEVFPESPEAKELNRKLILPPGPNNPVGVAWIGLDRPGYGIHGTPRPEDVGRTESHGCFRLANWNAEYLLRLIAVGTPVYVLE